MRLPALTWANARTTAVIVFPILVVLAQGGIPSGTWWDQGWDVPVLIAVLAGIGTVAEGIRALTAAGAREREETEADLRRLARRALGPINSLLPNVPIVELGVHIWVTDDNRLKRLVKYTIEQQRAQTPIRWCRGKGVIGVAWDSGAPLTADLTELYAEADRLSPHEFDALDPEHRYGLTHAEVRVGGRYRTVLAHPLTADGDVIGVLSVDCAADGQRDQLDKLLRDRAFQDVLGSCEAALQRYADR
jgi:hypothetical protein